MSDLVGDARHLSPSAQEALRLVWELWPAFVVAAKERDYASAREYLATARLLADEVQHAQTLWRDTSAENYSFDPMTMSWPRDFWLVMEDWRRGAGRR